MPMLEQFQGCLLGLALGDALGAPYEGGPLERFVWRLIGRTRDGRRCWTDDTQMTIDLAESWLAKRGIDQDDLAQRFAQSYRWSRGYGPGAAKLLKRIRRGEDWRQANRAVFHSGSFGNGAAMRAPILGLLYGDLADVFAAARQSAEITHAHPNGILGAELLAGVAHLLANSDARTASLQMTAQCLALSPEFLPRIEVGTDWLARQHAASPAAVRQELGNRASAHESCVTAVYLALRFLDAEFQELLGFAIALRGDVDTIAAMAGALWGTVRGFSALPKEFLNKLEAKERLLGLAEQLHAAATAS
jgi:poly(ADP-ribose) glycohydrolase ARH3